MSEKSPTSASPQALVTESPKYDSGPEVVPEIAPEAKLSPSPTRSNSNPVAPLDDKIPQSPTSPTEKAYKKSYRVKGVASTCNRETLATLLESVLPSDKAGQITVNSLADEPSRSGTRTTKTATVTFDGALEPILQDKIKTSTNKDIYSLSIDDEFLGFTPLDSADKTDYEIDFIAVHGLGGHAFGSFKERGGEHMWLRDSLPADCPKARVLTYGYKSKVEKSESFQTLENIATALMGELVAIREHTLFRPVIFMAHSLGGLVLKEALIAMAKSSEASHKTIFKSICGIMFFGVPSKGMKVGSLVAMAQDGANMGFLHSLAEGSPLLSKLHDDFCERVKYPDSMYYYYETVKSPTAQEVNGKWEMSGPKTEFVVEDSATKGHPGHNSAGHTEAIHRRHSELVKFTRADQAYNSVSGRISELIAMAPKIIDRFLDERGRPLNAELVNSVDPLSIAKVLKDDHRYNDALRWYKEALKKISTKIGKRDIIFYDYVYKLAISFRYLKLDGMAESWCRWALSEKAEAVNKSHLEIERVLENIQNAHPSKTAPVSDAITRSHGEIDGVVKDLKEKSWREMKGGAGK